jgi:hypothetical protein
MLDVGFTENAEQYKMLFGKAYWSQETCRQGREGGMSHLEENRRGICDLKGERLLLRRFSKVITNCEERFIHTGSTGLRAGGLSSNK